MSQTEMSHCMPKAARRAMARSRTTRSSRAIAIIVESRGTSQLIVAGTRQQKGMMEKVKNPQKSKMRMEMTIRSAGTARRRGMSQEIASGSGSW